MGCLQPVAGPAEDLKVVGFVSSAEGEGQYVVNVPRFAGVDLLSAGRTEPLSHEEQI